MEEGEDIFEAIQAVDTVEVECDSVNFILILRTIEAGENQCM